MKILADIGPLYAGPLTGVGYFTDELLKSMAPSSDITGFAFNFRNRRQVNLPYSVQQQTKLPGKVLTYPRYARIDLPLKMFFDTTSYDAVLATNYLLPPVGKLPSFVVIHDMCFIDHPEWVQSRNAHILRTMLPRTLKRATGIIVMSKFTKDRLKEIYDIDKPILLIDIPPKVSMEGLAKPARLNTEPGSYFLFISTIEPRKNLRTLLDAFEMLDARTQAASPLIVAGKPGWDPEVIERLKSSINQNIIYLDYVTEKERNWLYKNARVTIIPSHYEGFGMMTLESLSLGTPVITSEIPPHREILGESGNYFSPLDTKRLSDLLLQYQDSSFRSKSFGLQSSNLTRYSWQKTARLVSKFIETNA